MIHTVGPIWRDGRHRERELLTACYRNSLHVAQEQGCTTVAFPLISAGVYGYPKDQALQVAVETVEDFLRTHNLAVTLVLFDREAWVMAREQYGTYVADLR